MDFNYAAAAPEIFLGLAICVVLLVDVFLKDEQRATADVLSMLGLIGAAAVGLDSAVTDEVVTFNGAYITDPATGVLKTCAYVAPGVTFLSSRAYLRNNGLLKGEFF